MIVDTAEIITSSFFHNILLILQDTLMYLDFLASHSPAPLEACGTVLYKIT